MQSIMDRPECQEAVAALTRVKQQRSDLESEISRIHQANTSKTRAAQERERAIGAIIQGKPLPDPVQTGKELDRLYQERQLLDEAITRLEKKIEDDRYAASRALAEEMRPAVRTKAQRIAKAASELSAALIDLEAMKAELEAYGYAPFTCGALHHLSAPGLSVQTDHTGKPFVHTLRQLVADAQAHYGK